MNFCIITRRILSHSDVTFMKFSKLKFMLKELTSKSIVVEGLYVKKGGKFISNHTVYIPRLYASRVLQYKVLGNWNTHQSCKSIDPDKFDILYRYSTRLPAS